MVSLWGEPLLTRQIEQLSSLGIDDVIVVTGYKKEQIEALGIKTVFNPEYNASNMVYSLSYALTELSPNEEVIILYGDIAYPTEYLQVLINASVKDFPVAVLGNLDWYKLWSARLEEPLSDAETFIYDDNFKLIEIGQKPKSLIQVQAQYMGMLKYDGDYLIRKLSAFKHNLTEQSKHSYLTDFIQESASDGKVKVETVNGSWIEVDTIEDYELYSGKKPEEFGL
jgi:choline kinase